MKKKFLLVSVFVLFAFASVTAQLIKVMVAPDKQDWTYKSGEPVQFTISILQNNSVIKNAVVRYEIGPEKMPATKRDSLVIKEGMLKVNGGTLQSPGFLRCIATAFVDGKEYKGLATAGFDPEKIQPTVELAKDFQQFWSNAKTDLSKIPLDAQMVLMPERSTEKVNVYHVNFQTYPAGAKVYGILCVPKKEGRYPALLKVPGAGIRPYFGDLATAEKGVITLEIGIHGIPVNLDPAVYSNLPSGALSRYFVINLDNKDAYYYKRVYLGCVRANDFLFSLPQFDGKNLGVMGGSQGGALSIVTASLDPRVRYLAAYYPALSDMTGYLHNRAGGWPHILDKNSVAVNNRKEKLETISYYDVVNFARTLKTPGIYSWGYNDEVCPPTSMYAAYNSISSPKSLLLYYDTGHWTYPEQTEKMLNWMLNNLKK